MADVLMILRVRTDQIAPEDDQGLHCLPFCLHLLDLSLYSKGTLITAIFLVSEFSGHFGSTDTL